MRIIPRRLAITVAAGVGSLLLANGAAAQDNTVLTLLHFNDGESEVLPVDDAGGAARFIRKMDLLRDEANKDGAVITLSSGDNYLAGPRFNANLSLPDNQPYYDTLAIVHSRVDALAIGNHEFDFGPDVFARVAAPLRNRPYLSANLDFSGEPALQRLVDAGQIARSTVITRRGMEIGVIGATTPRLSFISSPGKVVVDPDVIGAVQVPAPAVFSLGFLALIGLRLLVPLTRTK
mgnify:CR=1 FL=1